MEGRYFTFTFNPIFATDDMIGYKYGLFLNLDQIALLRLYFRFVEIELHSFKRGFGIVYKREIECLRYPIYLLFILKLQ